MEKEILSAKEKLLIDGYIISKDARTAYSLLHPETKFTTDSLRVTSNRWLRKREEYIKQRTKEIFFRYEEETESKRKFRNKDAVLSALEAELPNLVGKERTDVLMKIADLQRFNKIEETPKEDRIHYYLPLQCKSCKLFLSYQEENH